MSEQGLSETSLVRVRGLALLDALEDRVPGSLTRAEGVAAWALSTAVELGMPRADCLAIREAARLHDVGAVYLPAAVLDLPRRLLDSAGRAERDAIVAGAGADLMVGAGVPDRACEWIRAVREHYDGSGVPRGLREAEIPLPARVIAAAMAYEEAITAPQRTLIGDANRVRALAEVAVQAGSGLDPDVVGALERAVERAARVARGRVNEL